MASPGTKRSSSSSSSSYRGTIGPRPRNSLSAITCLRPEEAGGLTVGLTGGVLSGELSESSMTSKSENVLEALLLAA